MSVTIQLHEHLDAALARMEDALLELGVALAASDTQSIEAISETLQVALVDGMRLFQQAGPQALTPDLRQRLQLAYARVQAQLQVVHKVLASTSRTLSILMPVDAQDTYDGHLGAAGNVSSAVNKAYR